MLIKNNIEVRHVAKEHPLPVFDGAKDNGYHNYSPKWWTNKACPYSYKYMSIDPLYPSAYFEIPDHPNLSAGYQLYSYMQDTFISCFDRTFRSVLELGTGSGSLTKQFANHNVDYMAVEGTEAGVEKLKKIGLDEEKIRRYNVKFMPNLQRRFDLVVCTEIAEHVEPTFSSKIVDDCIQHSDVVWFSSTDGSGSRPHYHHPNEQPIEAWDNLFAHMGFPYFIPLNNLYGRASRLYVSECMGRIL